MGEVTMLLDESRRVIEEVARRCFFKGKPYHYHACPVWANYFAKKENNHAGSY